MGLFRSSKTKGPVSPMPSQLSPLLVELTPKVLAAVTKCHRTGRDVGVATIGEGNELSIEIAGTNHRQEAMRNISKLVGGPGEKTAAAVVLSEPTNVFDKDAVRVLVDGVHIGFLPRGDAAAGLHGNSARRTGPRSCRPTRGSKTPPASAVAAMRGNIAPSPYSVNSSVPTQSHGGLSPVHATSCEVRRAVAHGLRGPCHLPACCCR